MVYVLKVIIVCRKYENSIEFDKIMETNSKNVLINDSINFSFRFT